MKYHVFIIMFMFISCSEPDNTHPLLQTDTNTTTTSTDLVSVSVAGISQELSPKLRVSNVGNETTSLGTLEKGIYLYSLNYSFSVGANNTQDSGYMSLKNSSDKVVKYISFPPNVADFKQMYLSTTDTYSAESFMVNTTDDWNLTLIHESELNDELRAQLTPHKDNYGEVGGDILYQYQWHLKNTGQRFAIENAVSGNDIDVEAVWDDNITGNGVRVAIVDEGVEINHPDLVDNMDVNSSWNFSEKSHDTTPTSGSNAHGTAVAGIVGASWKNKIGGRGVAPEATLVSYNLLEAQDVTSFPLAFAILDGKRGDEIDVFNNSWGLVLEGEALDGSCGRVTLNSFVRTADDAGCESGDDYCAFENQLEYGTKFGRDGKGSVYVKSAGNSAGCFEDNVNKSYMNSNWYPDQVERFMLVIGASRANGERSRYSTPGVNMLVNAPGGASQLAYLKPNELMVVTTDLTSSLAGYDNDANDTKLGSYHFSEDGNENHDYSDRMNGTSAAGPVVSGVVALMLQANPNLSSRDVKYILATTATKNPNTSEYTANGAGHTYSRYYGFGRVNANSAVTAAKTWTNLPSEDSEVVTTGSVNAVNSVATASFNVAKNLSVEYVNVEFGVNSFVNEPKLFTQTSENALFAENIPFAEYDIEFEADSILDDSGVNVDTNLSNANIDVLLKCDDGSTTTLMNVNLFAGQNTNISTSTLNGGRCFFTYETTNPAINILDRGSVSLTLSSGGVQYAYNLQVDLISPNGTTSNLVSAPNFLADESGDNNTTIVKTRMGSNEFLDESSNGVWQLRVSDVNGEYSTDFIIRYLKLEVFGR